MQKWQQQFSIGYFVIALILLFALQSFFASSQVETITYSQFKALAKKGLLSNVVIGEKIIRGEIKPEGLKEVLPAEHLKALNEQNKEAKTSFPFTVVRVEDPELISDLEKGGVQFKGEVTNEWVATVLSWVVPVVLFFLLWNYLFKRMGAGGGMMQIGKSKAKVYIEKKTGVTFADVEGIDEAEEESWWRSWSSSRTRKNIKDWAVVFRRVSCCSALRGRGKLYWRARWPAKRGCRSLAFRVPISWRCSLG